MDDMRLRIYNFLVNRTAGIRVRYHRFHDNSTGLVKLLSWAYLLWLNFAFYILQFRFLGRDSKVQVYESKRLNVSASETEEYHDTFPELTVESYVKAAEEYDIISFDIFDTLIFRPMAVPIDMFYLMGERLGITDFRNIRIFAESDARVRCMELYDHAEIDLKDIYRTFKEDMGDDYADAMNTEIDIELSMCFANPFMKQIWDELIKRNKKIIIVSDMYLPKKVIKELLDKNGYKGYKKLYLSNLYHKSKADGKLYDIVIRDYSKSRILHIGDNEFSDIKQAEKAGLDAKLYPNVNHNTVLYRSEDMSYLTGSAYRGITSTYLYNGLNIYSPEYEYGFIYGGLFVLGYCHFIHEYVISHDIDKLLFLSRDGDILMKSYTYMYPQEQDKCSYVYWSRKCATKLMAIHDKHDYFRRYIYHKINQEYTIAEILKSMELDCLITQLKDWRSINDKWNKAHISYKNRKKTKFIDLKADDELTHKNGYLLRRFIEAKWSYVEEVYRGQDEAAHRYYGDILQGVKKAVAIDIGWAGSGALSLSYLVEKAWKLPTQITGIIAGTNTLHNSEPDATDTFLKTGKLVSYLYSSDFNRDLYKKHNPSKDYNIFWEIILSSPAPQFIGFYNDNYIENKYIGNLVKTGDIYLKFGSYDKNREGIVDIQKGIMDFVKEYIRRFQDPVSGQFTYMYNISGRDAYAPMLLASSHNERYLKAMEKRFNLNINVE